ncbi:MAG: isocitrate lyase/PEP mutase family protein [Acidimicrobiales bacterium]
MSRLSVLADDLRARHFSGRPLLLANAWDAASARAVAEAGYPVIATSSAAIGASLGVGDSEQMTPDMAFAAVKRIAGAVELPVTADLEAGYGLSAVELVDRLLDAGAVGCNLEDSDHHGPAVFVDMDRQADYIAEICAAGRRAGVDVVVNARADVYLRDEVPPEDRMAETLRRGHRYLSAGATCVYPIGVTDPAEISTLVAQMGGPVNIWLRPDGPPLAELHRIGVARISLAAGLQRHTTTQIAALAACLLAGDDTWLRT